MNLVAQFCIGRTLIGFLFFLALLSSPSFSQPTAPDLTDQLMVGGWNAAVGITFDENGVIYVYEKSGLVYVVENGVKRSTPLLDISDEVGNWRDFGMLGVALDPNYLNNGYIYCSYVVDRHFLLNYDEQNPPGANYNPNANEYFNATIGRITRYTVTNPDIPSLAAADESTRFILVGDSIHNGFPVLHQSHGTGGLIFGEDGSLLASSGDGASYISIDVGGSVGGNYTTQALADGIISPAEDVGAYRSQLLGSLNGKIIRINPATGEGYPSNPFYESSNPSSNQSRVWALGLRNPARITLKPESGDHVPAAGNPGAIYIGDVGWGLWEELLVADVPGENFGWPMFEGMYSHVGYTNGSPYNQEAPTPAGCSQPYYKFSDLLKQSNGGGGNDPFTDPCGGGTIDPNQYNLFVHSKPEFDWRHGQDIARVSINGNVENVGNGQPNSVPGTIFRGNCSIAGAWYVGDDLPVEYKYTYFHGEFGVNWIKNFDFDTTHTPLWVRDFDLDSPNKGAVICLASDPINGGLYYIRYGSQLRRFIYNPSGNQPPVAAATQDIMYGPAPLTVNFDGSGSSDPEGNPLTYFWKFGDGNTSSQASPSHTFTSGTSTPTQYDVTLIVTDDDNQKDSTKLIVSTNNTPPTISFHECG